MQIDLNFPPDFTQYQTWSAPDPSFYEALAMGALPANHDTGDWYTVTRSPQGEILLNGCSPVQIFSDTCGAIAAPGADDRRVQLYQGGTKVADLPAVEAFYSALPDWPTWKAYYEAAGFTTSRTGTWTVSGGVPVVDPVIDPVTGEVIEPVPPILEASASSYLPYAIGAALIIALLRR